MTLDETRDRLAEVLGWKLQHDDKTPCTYWWKRLKNERRECVMGRHPIPTTMDAAHAILTEAGFEWKRQMGGGHFDQLVWMATPYGEFHIQLYRVTVPDTGNPAHDLLTLALKALEPKGTR